MTIGLIGWLVIIGAGVIWEAIAVRANSGSWPTLTDLIRDHLPKWVIAAALGWLAFHLLAQPAHSPAAAPPAVFGGRFGRQ